MTAGTGRRATIIDVAAAAGVSRQTVTRAMNDMPGVAESTKARVLAAAAELEYRPSRFGRGLVGHAQRTVGLVVDDLANPYYPQLASAVVASAASHGWNVVLAQRTQAAHEQALLAELAQQADVIIGYPRWVDGGARAALSGVPLVLIDPPAGSPGGGVELDVTSAMADLADHLVARGTTSVGLLDASTDGGEVSSRGRILLKAMARHQVPVVSVPCESRAFASGTEGAEALLAAHPHVDAIVAFNDMMACGALKALHEAAIDVPGRIRLAGCDGLHLGGYVYPALTTLAVDMTAVAKAAVEMALGMFEGEVPLHGARARVAHRLLVRAST